MPRYVLLPQTTKAPKKLELKALENVGGWQVILTKQYQVILGSAANL